STIGFLPLQWIVDRETAASRDSFRRKTDRLGVHETETPGGISGAPALINFGPSSFGTNEQDCNTRGNRSANRNRRCFNSVEIARRLVGRGTYALVSFLPGFEL